MVRSKKISTINKLIIWASVFIALLFGTLVVVNIYNNSTHDAINFADEFSPDVSWRLESSEVIRAEPICPKSCPQVERTWVRSAPVTCDELASYIPKSWGIVWKQDCSQEAPSTGYSVQGGTNNGYYVYLWGDSVDSGGRILLTIRKE